MVKVSPARLAPSDPASAAVLAPDSDVRVSVAVPLGTSSFVFEFDLTDGVWVGQHARAVRPWTHVTAEWLAAAWEVAAEALRRHLSGSVQEASVRCGECARVVPVPSDAPGPVAEILCGTEHALMFANGKSAVIDASGRVVWGELYR